MAKLIVVVAVLSSIACGSGSNEVAPLGGTTRSANAVTGSCTNAPNDCGVRVCVDCTANAPPGTEPACVAGKCEFPCAAGFHLCGTTCSSDTDANSCGSRCDPCPQPANSFATCVSGACDFDCNLGFGKTGAFCVSLSFSLSY